MVTRDDLIRELCGAVPSVRALRPVRVAARSVPGLLRSWDALPQDGKTLLHFSNHRDWLGFHPQQQWHNPLGTYGYVVGPKLTATDLIHNSKGALFRQNTSKWVHVLRPTSGTKLLTPHASKGEWERALHLAEQKHPKAADVFVKILHHDAHVPTSTDDTIEHAWAASVIAQRSIDRFPKLAGEAQWCADVWFLTRTCAASTTKVQTKLSARWTALLRMCGYGGVIDSEGTGLFDGKWPVQGVLFPGALDDAQVTTYRNDTPAAMHLWVREHVKQRLQRQRMPGDERPLASSELVREVMGPGPHVDAKDPEDER